MKVGFLPLLVAAMAFASCAPGPAAPFTEGPLAQYGGRGSGRVSGVATDAKTPEAKPSEVTLVPVTAYTKVIEARIQSNFDPLRALDPRLQKYLRRTTPDAARQFSFSGVPAGEYYVVFCASKTSTNYVTMSDGSSTPEDSLDYRYLYARVSVAPGQPVRASEWRSP
jgi:hypothetical protein